MRVRRFFETIVLLVFGICFLGTDTAQGQTEKELEVSFTIPPIALLDIEPSINNTIYFAVVPSSESGASPTVENTSNQVLWLNYSSATEIGRGSRTVVAQISGGDLPDGITLSVSASEYRGNGAGQLGQSADKVKLSSQPRAILSSVGNCYTGDGEGNGHALTFSIEVEDYSQISSNDETAFTILYTIRDN